MPRMGQFRVTARLTGPTGHSEEVEFLIDTGSMLLGLPSALAERLELVPELDRRVMLADGTMTRLPVADVRLTLGGESVTTPCYIVPTGTPLLGAVALQSLFLAVDPVNERLVPIQAYI
jgi:clan AA aspartic protease